MHITSFDVFDTLLTRALTAPVDVFPCVAEKIGDPKFAAMRPEAERAARKTAPAGEIGIAAIYDELARRLQWTTARRDAAMACEIELEEQQVYAIEPMRAVVDAARRAGDQIVFLTDMYLPGELITRWLQRENFFQPADRLYVSGEHGAGKGSGELFEKVRRELGASFDRWTHYGDHPWSDGKRPRSLGIATRAVTLARLTPREKQAAGSRLSAVEATRLAGAMRRARLSGLASTERHATLNDVAANVAGPAFYGFVEWCLAEAARRGIRRLYFLSRGGQIFWRIAQEIVAQRNLSIDCRYLYSSRLAFAVPALTGDVAKLRELIAPTTQHHSIRQALVIAGIEEREATDHVPPALGSDWDRNLRPDERTVLADALLAGPARHLILARLDERADLSRAYLEQQGVRRGEPIALVDTGWFGSTQRGLEQLLGSASEPVPLVGFYFGLVEQTGASPAGEMLGYTNRFNRLSLRRETSHLILVELLAQADHGPLIGFRRESNGAIGPILDTGGPVDVEEIRFFHDSILRFACLNVVAASDAWFSTAISLYRDFHDRPTRAEVRVFGGMPHADQWKEASFATLAPRMNWLGAAAAVFRPGCRPPCWWIAGQAASGAAWLRAYALVKRLKWRVQTAFTGLRD